MTPSSKRSPAQRAISTMTIPDIPPGAGQWRYGRKYQSSRISGSFRIDTGDRPTGSGYPGFHRKALADQRRAGTSSSTVFRHRDAALCPLAQTAGFRSDAASDRADRLYIVNGDEVMCKAEPARWLQRRSGDVVSVILQCCFRDTALSFRSPRTDTRNPRIHFEVPEAAMYP